jgi:carboxymethylenebutenolidase
MCFQLDSFPPIPVISGAAISHDDLVLQAADGNRFAAFAATPDEPSTVGVVVLPDVRGLYRFYEELALRFAERGVNAVAIDYFGRTAGIDKRDDEFDWAEHVKKLKADGLQADIAAAVELLRSPAGGGCGAIFTLGFCLGGRISWLAAISRSDLAGAIGFYGNPGDHPLLAGPGPTERATEIKAPILALQAGDDQNITPELNAAFENALTAAGVAHELVTYDGAPHSFFDRRFEEFASQSDDAWQRALAFIEGHSHNLVEAELPA